MLKITIEDIMSEQIVRVKESVMVGDVAHLLMRYQINGVLVVDDEDKDKLIGILTTTDMLWLFDDALSHRTQRLKALERISQTPVGDVASRDVITLQQDLNITKAIALMHQKNIHTIPIYKKDKLVGVLGRHDVLNIALSRGGILSVQDKLFQIKKSILVIEDNDVDQKFIKKTLKKQGFRVVVAPTGERGLEIAEKDEIDLIVLDINLPDISGDDVYKRLKLKSKTKDIPVLILTVIDSPQRIIEYFQLGAMNYLIKPVTGKDLLVHIDCALKWKEMEGKG